MDLAMENFEKADHTVIISDLHLCEAEPIHPRFPLWKKYKTEAFFFDDKIHEFLRDIHKLSDGKEIELILNGDIFDFDSVCKIPKDPPFRVNLLEAKYGLRSEEQKSLFKINTILDDHAEFVNALRWFLGKGHRIIFVIGNHDLELFWESVQGVILNRISSQESLKSRVRFCEFFYISNRDTLVEHGHQYDPYCKIENPVFPFTLRYNRVELRIPFGNLATRYMINSMGFFNPYVEANFIMTAKEYVVFFLKYIVRAQPFLILSWLSGASLVLFHSIRDEFSSVFRDPLLVERRIENIAKKSNATPRVVRELMNLSIPSAAKRPWLLARELWLDRAFIFLVVLLALLQVMLLVKHLMDISLFWVLIPLFVFAPFFIFYSRTVQSKVGLFKEPQERILSYSAMVTNTKRVVYGHTHVVRHEQIGPVEHLNSGTWSPAFKDVHCTEVIDQKTAIWIYKDEGSDVRKARILQFGKDGTKNFFNTRTKRSASNIS